MKKNIEKLNIDLISDSFKEDYEKERANYIANYEIYIKGYDAGFFKGWVKGRYEKRPDIGEAKWNERYPNGFNDWRKNSKTLNSVGQQNVINKINEIIDYINSTNNPAVGFEVGEKIVGKDSTSPN